LIISHQGKRPRIARSAYIAANAVICGDVVIGEHCRIMYGAQVIAEGGAITIGKECIVMANAVLRSTARHSLSIGNNCLVTLPMHGFDFQNPRHFQRFYEPTRRAPAG
jgi:carbonic anhydrase/acetyltransferase-like protein (isoleucine patch superfamily)